MDKLQQLAAYLELNQIDTLPQLKPIQQKTTLKPSILLILLSAFFLVISIFIDLSALILAIVCVLIPGYFTFQVIGTKVQKEYIKYIVYWISFGLMEVIVEPIVSMIFGSFFLIIVEATLVIALLHPKFNFALIIYDRIIRVYVLKEQSAKLNQSSQKSAQKQPQPPKNVQTTNQQKNQ